MSNIFRIYNDLEKASQLKNIYLGTLVKNTDPTDLEYNGTYFCKNVPIYLDQQGRYTYTVTETPYTDGEGHQYYCPKFFKDLCDGYITDYSLVTTESHGVCPIGDFDSDLNLINIKVYPSATVVNNTNSETYSNMNISALSRENILRILAGLERDGDKIYTINLPYDAEPLTDSDEYLLKEIWKIKYVIRKEVRTNTSN